MSGTSIRTDLSPGNPPERLGLVFNPTALRNAKDPEASRGFLAAFNDLGKYVLVGELEDTIEALRNWKDEGLDLLVISGGDGTVQVVIDSMISIWQDSPLPRLLLIHGGTAGIVARETGNVTPQLALSRLSEAKATGRTLPVETLHTLSVGERITLSFALGLFRQLSSEYITYGGQAAFSHLLLGARFTGSFLAGGPMAKRTLTPCPYTILIDDREYPPNHFVGLFVSGLRRLEVFRPYQGVECPEDGFKVVGIQDMGPLTLMRGIRPVLKGDHEGLPEQLLLCGTRQMEVRCEEDGEIPYMVDGEFYSERGSITVRSGPDLSVVRLDHMD